MCSWLNENGPEARTALGVHRRATLPIDPADPLAHSPAWPSSSNGTYRFGDEKLLIEPVLQRAVSRGE